MWIVIPGNTVALLPRLKDFQELMETWQAILSFVITGGNALKVIQINSPCVTYRACIDGGRAV